MTRLGFDDHEAFFRSASVPMPTVATKVAITSRSSGKTENELSASGAQSCAMDADATPTGPQPISKQQSAGRSGGGGHPRLPVPEIRGDIVGTLDRVAERTEDGDHRGACRLMYDLLLANTTLLDVNATRIPALPAAAALTERKQAPGARRISEVR